MNDRDLFAGGAILLGATTLARGLVVDSGAFEPGRALSIAGGMVFLGAGAYGLLRSDASDVDLPRPLVGLFLVGVALYVVGVVLFVAA